MKTDNLDPPEAAVDVQHTSQRIIEHVVKTTNPRHPRITLFLRLPEGVADGSQVKGVLAMCVLANSVGDIRRKLQGDNPSAEMGVLARFADKHKLAILCWGAQVLWRAGASYDELERQTNRELDQAFDVVANAWERGVVELHSKYGIPQENFLLWGICGSAQWAHRLALRKPHRFLAVYIHIPSSFDRPTPEAANVLWLLTTGELDGGYERGSRFFTDCRNMGYPIIYKAIMALGHAGSPVADNLGLALFDYALSVIKRLRVRITGTTHCALLSAPRRRIGGKVFSTRNFWGIT